MPHIAEPSATPFTSIEPQKSGSDPFYETCCGLCGAQVHFRHPLTDWTKVYCPGCGEYVAVR